ncbi:MAG TPA: hypothetical protein VGL81_30905 [Polyangiaceae bacterium]|jgi:hypothetical protein
MPGAAEDRARIEAAIREASEYVARMPPTPGARELKTRLETFQRVVQSWRAIHRPTTEQVDALIERVNEVRRLATSTAPTARRKRYEPDGGDGGKEEA